MTTDLAIELQEVDVNYLLRNAHHYNVKRAIANAITRRQDKPEIIRALRDVSIQIPKGSRVGLMGPNGAGKTTLLAVMAGLLKPTQGRIDVQGRVLALLGGPNEGLDPEQTGRENALSLGIRLGESPDQIHEAIDSIREFSGLGARFDHPVYTYSSGMHVRLRFSTITSVRADVLIVDEGIGAADAEFNERANGRLESFYESAGTLVLASHSPELLRTHCTSFFALESGSVHRTKVE